MFTETWDNPGDQATNQRRILLASLLMMAEETQDWTSSTLHLVSPRNTLRARLEDLVLPTLHTDVGNTAYGGCVELDSMEQDTCPRNRQQCHRRRVRRWAFTEPFSGSDR